MSQIPNFTNSVQGVHNPVQILDEIIDFAEKKGASDIHFESLADSLQIRIRIDGVLRVIGEFSSVLRARILSRIKILSNLDIAEKRRPQDGKMDWVKDGKSVLDIRVSSFPTIKGEKLVLRLLRKVDKIPTFTGLGMNDWASSQFENALSAPNGIIIVTGPTGSGKTTTLYSALSYLHSPDVNISTIEDPVEYQIKGINQAQVNAEIGFTFAKALRALLRQDPDILLVGEIRDQETAEIAVRAALTGHLVLTTLHTNDALSAFSRLSDLGVPSFLLADTLRLIIAQRLVRTLCSTCNGQRRECEDCGSTGFRGRRGVYEIIPVNVSTREILSSSMSHEKKYEALAAHGVRRLREVASELVSANVTTYNEIIAELGAA